MSAKEIIGRRMKSIAATFFGASLAAYLSMLIFGIHTMPVNSFGVLLAVSILIELSNGIFYSVRVLSKRQMMVRYIFHAILILIIATSTAVFMNLVNIRYPLQVIIFVVFVAIVYIVILLSGAHQMSVLTNRLNKKLRDRYKDKGDEADCI